MCGISGVIGVDLKKSDISTIESLTEKIKNRGPDGKNLVCQADQGFIIGHTRLSVIDLSESAGQPFSDATGSTYVVFNGEIYNYIKLRKDLKEQGYLFRTASDTEVIINGYLAYGPKIFEKLQGMFAICILDLNKKKFFLFRDKFGIKPLYFYFNGTRLYFCSSHRALATELGLSEIDRDSAASFAFQGFVQGPGTITKKISSLGGGRLLSGKLMLDQRLMEKKIDLSCANSCGTERASASISMTQRVNKLGIVITEAVDRHLVSDVRLGLFLSGGIDSGIILGALKLLGRQADVLPISISFDSQVGKIDETLNASRLCDHFNIVCEVRRFSKLYVLNQADAFFSDMDQPSLDGPNIWFASQVAKECGVKVVLSGLGGDEFFGGYPSFKRIPFLLKYGLFLKKILNVDNQGILDIFIRLVGMNANKLRLLRDSDFSIEELYIISRSLGKKESGGFQFKDFMDEEISKLIERMPTEYMNSSLGTKISNLETFHYMENQLLRDSDWASMSHGVELRVPFVDEELYSQVRYLFGEDLYPDLKKDLAKNFFGLPRYIWDRPKTGFGTPIAKWIEAAGIKYEQRVANEFGI